LSHGAPDEAGNSDDGSYDEEPPKQPDDAGENERGDNHSKDDSD